MTRDELIEAMARAIWLSADPEEGAMEWWKEQARAALEAIEAQGLAIVPVEATEAMQDVAYDDVFDIYWGYMADGRKGGACDVYSAMIKAGRL